MKLYNNNSLRRFVREVKSFYFLEYCSYPFIPKLLTHSYRYNDQTLLWSLFSYISSVPRSTLSRSSINSRIFKAYHHLSYLQPTCIPVASDFSRTSHFNSIKCLSRLTSMQDYLALNYPSFSRLRNLFFCLHNVFVSTKDHFLYSLFSHDLIFSHSDVGMHNLIVNSDNIYLIDFEYSGIDDKYKFLSDLILNPSNSLYTLNDLSLLSSLTPNQFFYKSFISRFYYQFFKWIPIYCRCLLNSQNSYPEDIVFDHVSAYYDKFFSFLDLPLISYDTQSL